MKPKRKSSDQSNEEAADRKPQKVSRVGGGAARGSQPAGNAEGVDPDSRQATSMNDTDNIFDRTGVSDADIGAVINSLGADNGYMLHLSVCPVLPRPRGEDDGPVQRSIVVVVRFQKTSNSTDCWCMKSAQLIDALKALNDLVPAIGLAEFVGSLGEYTLREMPQGPSVPLTRNTRNGGRFETRVVAAYVPLGPRMDYKKVIDGIGTKLSDFLRSNLFAKIFLGFVEKSSKESAVVEPGRQKEGIYGIIKDPAYFLWDAVKTHRLVVSYDVPLDNTFLDPDISGMLSRMFPDGDCLALPAVRSVGYGKCEDDQSSD